MLMKQLIFLTVLLVLNSKDGQCHKLHIRTTAADASGCQGKLDLAKFSKVNQVCEECYSLYKEIEVYKLCR